MMNPLAADATGRAVALEQLMLLFFGLLVGLISATPASGTDLEQPARLQITIVDEENRSLPAARVWLRETVPPWPESPDVPALLPVDAEGRVDLQRRLPEGATEIRWWESLRFELDGFVSKEHSVQLFPGAHQQITVTMLREHETLIRLRGPKDEPLPRVTVYAGHTRGGTMHQELLFTDDQGECRWRHTSLDAGYWIEAVSDEGTATTGDRVQREGATITLTFDESPLPFSARVLKGRLLNADGSVASGWHVARRADRFGGGGLIRGPFYNGLQMRQLTPVDAEGNFEVDVDAQGWLAVVSPAGIPLLYSLAPENWPPGVREVSLRLPSVRRVHHGVIVDEQDEPVAGLPIDLHSVRWNGQNWTFSVAAPESSPERRSQDWIADTPTLAAPRTDRQGNYSIAVYTGSTADFQVWHKGWRRLSDLSMQERHVWRQEKTATAEDLSKFKRVTLLFEDDQQQPIESIQLDRVEMYAGDEVVSRSAGGVRDARGLHLFVDAEVDRIDLRTRDLAAARSTAARWLPLETSISVPGSDDQLVRLTLTAALRQRPLSGRVVDPDGQPVPRVGLSLLRPARESPDARGGHSPYLGIATTADEHGRFVFAAAPDDCRINAYRKPGEDPLPGWTDPVDVDAQNRDVTIRINRGGTVKVLLPPWLENAADAMLLEYQDAADDGTRDRYWHFRLHRDDPPAIVSENLPPGRYLLMTSGTVWASTEPLAVNGPVSVEVEASELSVVDLRNLATAPGGDRLQRMRHWNNLSITHNGRHVSGADVMVVTTARPQELARWMELAKSDDAAVKEAGLALLRDAGLEAIKAIRNAAAPADAERLLDDLGEPETTGLWPVAYDLSDNLGNIRCEVEAGRPYAVVARVRGRLIGWRSWVASEEDVAVELQPSRTLAVRLADADPAEDSDWDFKGFDLKLEQPADLATMALMTVLCRDAGYPFLDNFGWLPMDALTHQRCRLYRDTRTTWVMEDLPVGSECTIRFLDVEEPDDERPAQERRNRIEPGQGVQMVRW